MKKVFVLIVALLVPFVSHAADDELGFWFEAQAVSGKNPEKVIAWYERNEIMGLLGFFASALRDSSKYQAYYLGPTVKPMENLTLGIGVGRENQPGDYAGTRRAVWYDLKVGKFTSFGLYENGASGPWHKVEAMYAVTERFGIGAMDETDLGAGPRVEYNLKGGVQLWGAVLRKRHREPESGRANAVIGINYSF